MRVRPPQLHDPVLTIQRVGRRHQVVRLPRAAVLQVRGRDTPARRRSRGGSTSRMRAQAGSRHPLRHPREFGWPSQDPHGRRCVLLRRGRGRTVLRARQWFRRADARAGGSPHEARHSCAQVRCSLPTCGEAYSPCGIMGQSVSTVATFCRWQAPCKNAHIQGLVPLAGRGVRAAEGDGLENR